MRAAQEAEERARAEHEAWARAQREAAERARAEHEARLRAEHEAAERARLEYEAAVRAANEEAARVRAEQEEIARLAREQAEIARAEQEAAVRAAEQAAAKAQEEREASMRAAEEEARRAKLKKEEEIRRAKEEETRLKAAQQEAEKNLREGIRPEVTPTDEEIRSTKERLEYAEGSVHLAIAGMSSYLPEIISAHYNLGLSGTGKSSLINAFRGLRNSDAGAAATGVIETTATITRYPDPHPGQSVVWYDVPGAGTLNIPDWQYFNAQGLYVFDCIIVLFDSRFTATDVAILKHCARFQIPSYIVRSKSNQHIRNIAVDMGYDEDEDDDSTRLAIFQAARDKYIEVTHENVKRNLDEAELPQQRVYIVAKDILRAVVQHEGPKHIIDEEKLVEDLLSTGKQHHGLAKVCKTEL